MAHLQVANGTLTNESFVDAFGEDSCSTDAEAYDDVWYGEM